jgi:hypothetical protein
MDAPIQRHRNVSVWLETVLTATDNKCLLYPQQPTLKMGCRFSLRLRLLSAQERTFGEGAREVRV